MAWLDDALIYLSILVGDGCDEPPYNESKLINLLLVSARFTSQDIYFPQNYQIDISAQTITPDPSSDAAFINFVVLRGACLVDNTTLRTKSALAGIISKVGPASLEIKADHLSGFKYLIEHGPCQMYADMKLQYQFSQNLVYTVQAILSPFVGNGFYPQDHFGYYSGGRRDRYTDSPNMI